MNDPTRSAADILADIDKAAEAEAAPPAPDEIVPRELPIPVSYRLGDGTVLEGVFVHRVPSIEDERRIALASAIMRGGQPRGAFGAYENDAIDALAYLSKTLVVLPEWAREKGLGDVMDPALLFAVAQEATAHRDRFRRASRDLRPSPGAVR